MPRLTEEKFNSIIRNAVETLKPLDGWFPTQRDAELLCDNMDENFEFLIWVVDSNPTRQLTEEQKRIRKYIRDRINKSIVFIAPSGSKSQKTKEG